MIVVEAARLVPPKLRFHPAMPSRVHLNAYQGLRTHGPFDRSRVHLMDGSLLLLFPSEQQDLARKLAYALVNGYKSFPGFERMFHVPLKLQTFISLPIHGDFATPNSAARTYREQIASWSTSPRQTDPHLVFALVPHSQQWETDRPYYETKAAFARLGIPTQMVTIELITDERQFSWSVANIALAAFAKLGGVPWTVDAPAGDTDVVIGVGRADIRHQDGSSRIFGYAVTFVANGVYRHTWSFTPAADEETYAERLEDALVAALEDDRDRDEPAGRIVLHLAKRTGWREIAAARRALSRSNVTVPTVFVRLDDSTLYDIGNGAADTFAPPKGLAVRLGPRRALLQTEGLGPLGPPEGPLLIELDERSSVGEEAMDGLVEQTFRLAHANWRGFNARSQPVSLAYGELLAKLVGYLEEVDTWDPRLLRSEFQERPWFL